MPGRWGVVRRAGLAMRGHAHTDIGSAWEKRRTRGRVGMLAGAAWGRRGSCGARRPNWRLALIGGVFIGHGSVISLQRVSLVAAPWTAWQEQPTEQQRRGGEGGSWGVTPPHVLCTPVSVSMSVSVSEPSRPHQLESACPSVPPLTSNCVSEAEVRPTTSTPVHHQGLLEACSLSLLHR